jgi:hypothetical protein
MKSFQSRVNKIIKDGDLTVADLRDWFKRPYATVWRWTHSGWVPRGPDGPGFALHSSAMDPVTPVFKLNKTVAGNTTRMAGRILDLDIDPSPLFHCTYPRSWQRKWSGRIRALVRRECDDSQKRVEQVGRRVCRTGTENSGRGRADARGPFEYARAYVGHLHKIRGRARYSASQNGRFHEHHRTQPSPHI